MTTYTAALEEVELGHAGTYTLYQYRAADFNDLCLTSNSEDQDATGLRVYAGAHILARFLASPTGMELLHGKKAVELGCGTGVVGCVAAVKCELKQLVLTDGDVRSCELAQKNAQHIVKTIKPDANVSSQQLYWGTALPPTLQAHAFDVVLGCELMYYQTNVQALVSTVLALAPNGLFVHAHLFRDEEHGETMRELFASVGWSTLVIPVPSFVPPKEMSVWASWFNVCCLVSGPDARIRQLQASNPSWPIFVDVETTQDENIRVSEEMEEMGQS